MSHAFRTKHSSPNLHVVADLYGSARQVSAFKRSGDQAASFRDLDEPEPEGGAEPDPIMERLRLRRAVADLITRYEASGHLTNTQLRTIRALWLESLSLHEVARREGVAAEGVRARIEGSHGCGGLRHKAPEFYRWWAFKHRNRRKKGVSLVRRRHHSLPEPTPRAA